MVHIRLFAETSRQIGLTSSSAVEKDWWVVQTLAVIFSMDCANALIFKGGTCVDFYLKQQYCAQSVAIIQQNLSLRGKPD
jgi:predicted nucleotidyltransferase component of viral defense system